MARSPDCMIVACPECYAEPGDPCTRLRLTGHVPSTIVVREPVHVHRARRNAFIEERRARK